MLLVLDSCILLNPNSSSWRKMKTRQSKSHRKVSRYLYENITYPMKFSYGGSWNMLKDQTFSKCTILQNWYYSIRKCRTLWCTTPYCHICFQYFTKNKESSKANNHQEGWIESDTKSIKNSRFYTSIHYIWLLYSTKHFRYHKYK